MQIAIRRSDFQKYGCPKCGCSDAHLHGGIIAYGVGHFQCFECGEIFVLTPDDCKHVNEFGTGIIYSQLKREDGKDRLQLKGLDGQFVYENPVVIQHPRIGISPHKFVKPDLRPSDGIGEFWSSRGPSSFDCSGFIESKEAGERILEMVHDVLGVEKSESWLDYREFEPTWIQFKFSANEFNVDKLDKLASDYKVSQPDGRMVVTRDMLIACVIR